MWTDRSTANRTSNEKLIELRLKTDRDLTSLVEMALNRIYRLLLRSEREQAVSTYARAAALSTLIRALPVQDRQQLERRLGHLRNELDQTAFRKRLAS